MTQPRVLSEQDMSILQSYLDVGDIIGYYDTLSEWGYRYGNLAAGVAGNDTLFGETANAFLVNAAADQGVQLSSYDITKISLDLAEQDFAERSSKWFSDPYQQVTLSYAEVSDVHQFVFSDYGLDIGAWTAAYIEPVFGSEAEERWQDLLGTGDSSLAQLSTGAGILLNLEFLQEDLRNELELYYHGVAVDPNFVHPDPTFDLNGTQQLLQTVQEQISATVTATFDSIFGKPMGPDLQLMQAIAQGTVDPQAIDQTPLLFEFKEDFLQFGKSLGALLQRAYADGVKAGPNLEVAFAMEALAAPFRSETLAQLAEAQAEVQGEGLDAGRSAVGQVMVSPWYDDKASAPDTHIGWYDGNGNWNTKAGTVTAYGPGWARDRLEAKGMWGDIEAARGGTGQDEHDNSNPPSREPEVDWDGDGRDDIGLPVAFDLDGDGQVALVDLSNSSAFYDFSGDGFRNWTTWIGAADGLLGYDANGDGTIAGRNELVFVDYAPGAQTDLEGLRAFDSNGDLTLTSADAQWQSFYLWQDIDQDGISDPGELQTLQAAGITGLSLVSDGNRREVGPNILFGDAAVSWANGRTTVAVDAAIAYSVLSIREAAGAVDLRLFPEFTLRALVDSHGQNLNLTSEGLSGLIGGAGADSFSAGGDLPVLISGGAGNDTLTGGTANDILLGDDGDDHLIGGAGDDLLSGGAGADVIDGGAGVDQASFQGEDDRVEVFLFDSSRNKYGATGETYLNIENLIGTNHNDGLYGDANSNLLRGGMGNDELYGGGGDDILQGGDGDDRLIGAQGADVMNGGDGFDRVWYGFGENLSMNMNDPIRLDLANPSNNIGESYGDKLISIESVQGTFLGDQMFGDSSSNELNGYFGNDTLNGRGGDDRLFGHSGDDVMTGGSGADEFIFFIQQKSIYIPWNPAGWHGVDTIVDFETGRDTILLNGIVGWTGFNAGRLSLQNMVFGASALEPDDLIMVHQGAIFYDIDGSGPIAQVHLANIGVDTVIAPPDVLLQ